MRVAADVQRPSLPHVVHELAQFHRRDEPLHEFVGIASLGVLVSVLALLPRSGLVVVHVSLVSSYTCHSFNS